MTTASSDNTATLHHGDCLDILHTLADGAVDAVITDPPYGLSFMGKRWDHDVPSADIWSQCLRVLKPGGHLLAFFGTRTYHRGACAVEDAGFEIRDQLGWMYGSGFPKSMDVSKAIDKAAGAKRERYERPAFGGTFSDDNGTTYGTAISNEPATPEAAAWQGWGTALKPAWEPIVLARKPLVGTVAANVLEHGTGALNVDGCRVGDRWPANVLHDDSDEVIEVLGDARRFFYCAKASAKERDAGLTLPVRNAGIGDERPSGQSMQRLDGREAIARRNHHPTVKPVALMRYLVRLVTPPGAIVLDPFMGSGSTGVAALLEGRRFIGIEQSAEYVEIARQRIEAAQ